MNDLATDTSTAALVELEWWDRRTGSELVEHAAQALHAAGIDHDSIHVYQPLLLDYSPHGDGECSLWMSVRTGHPVHEVTTAIRAAGIRVKSAEPCPAHLVTADNDALAGWHTSEHNARYTAH